MRDKILSCKFALLAALVTLNLTCGNTFARTLIWNDEFDGTSLDTSKWEILDEPDWYKDGKCCWYAPHNVEVSGGTLKLYNKEESYHGCDWTGAHIDALHYPQYKYLEARIRHSAPDTYIWATWWTVGWTGSTWQWPPEFDICEFQGGPGKSPGQWYHWDYDGSGHQWAGSDTGMDESQWHTYGVYWSETQGPIFYVDGIISCIPGGPLEGALMAAKLKLTTSPNRDNHYSGCPLAVFEVDYVRVYDVPPDQPPPATHLALNKPADASSVENSGLTADKAVDGIDSSRWASEWGATPQWIRVDLEATYSIDEVKLYWEYASAKEYKIQVADDPDGPWTDCIHITNNTTHQGWKTHEFPPQTGRYLRVYCIQRTTIWGYSIFELEVYQDCEGADIDNSGSVNLNDFSILSNYWLNTNCDLYNDCDGADIYDDNTVDFYDLAILARHWLCNGCSGQ